MLRGAECLSRLTGRDEKFPILFSDVKVLVPGAEARRHLRLSYFGLHDCKMWYGYGVM